METVGRIVGLLLLIWLARKLPLLRTVLVLLALVALFGL